MQIFQPHNEQDHEIIKNLDYKAPYVWIATWFKSGLLNPAPGTWGSLAGLITGVTLLLLGGMGLLVVSLLLLMPIGFWATHKFEKATGTQDCKMIVVDEVIGMWIVLLVTGSDPILLVLGFLFFRAFDIFKLWPASFFDQHFKNAFGVIMDDVFAGLYAALLVIVIKGMFGL